MPGDVVDGERDRRPSRSVREIAADFLNAPDPDEISFHFSSTQALFNLALSMRGLIRARNNLVVTDLDHMANVSPWESVGGKWWGAHVRRARILDTGELDMDHLLSLIDDATAVVAVPLASNGLGTIVPLETLIPSIRKKAPKCLVCVDAVHHALHGPIDVQSLDCDLLVFSGYKVFGPMLGVMWGKREILKRMKPFRVETNRNEPPFKFEQGTLNNASLASLGAALRYIVWLADELDPELAGEDRRSKFRRAMAAVASYEREISRKVLVGFRNLAPDRFRLFGNAAPRKPLFGIRPFPSRSPASPPATSSVSCGKRPASRSPTATTTRPPSSAISAGRRASAGPRSPHYDNAGTADIFLAALAGLEKRLKKGADEPRIGLLWTFPRNDR